MVITGNLEKAVSVEWYRENPNGENPKEHKR